MLMTFRDLKKNLGKDFSGFQKLKVALLGDSATQFIVQALRGYGFESRIDFDIYESDYDQIAQQVSNAASSLYQFNPDVIILLQSTEKLLEKFYGCDFQEQKSFAESMADTIKNQVSMLQRFGGRCQIIMANYPEIDDGVYGNSANKYEGSFAYAIRKLNIMLMELAREKGALHILDLAAIQNRYGRNQVYDPRLDIEASMFYSLDIVPVIAKRMVDIIHAGRGVFKKCVILDLDHTLWGGVIGDDGIEKIEIGDLGIGKAYTALQRWLRQLRMRGLLLAVCSKNTESVAKEPFEKHADMVLRLDDISVFVANWNNKVDNIRYIQSVMNIGFDSMVFLDDNPFERNLVREHLPDVTVPELPEDPVEYLGYLQSLNLFEAGTITEQDFERTRMIQDNLKARALESAFASEGDFLRSMQMKAIVAPFNTFNTPRVAQLSQRSNQYNLRTLRYSEEDIRRIAKGDTHIGLAFTLKDKLSDHGLISAVVLEVQDKQLFIENWFMSCRVLKRGVELLALNTIVDIARKKGALSVIGEYIPTAKNSLVQDHYARLGFTPINATTWSLEIAAFSDLEHFISMEGPQ